MALGSTANANIKAVITAEDRASKVIQGFGKDVEQGAEKVKKGFDMSRVATLATTTAVTLFGKKSFDAFTTQELATTRLQAGINNVKSATDKNIQSLLDQASAFQKSTRFSDEAIVSAQGIFTTFQLNQDAISKLTPRILDMAEGLAKVDGTMPDLEGNAILVAKALGGEDVVGLVGALRRVGVVMTQHQTDLLTTGDMQTRLSVITQVLDQNFKGMAEAAGTTTAGKLEILKNKFGEIQEKVGSVLADVLVPVFNLLNAHPAVLTAATIALGLLATAFLSVKAAAAIGTVISGVTTAITAMSTATGIATGSLTALSTISLAAWGAGVVTAFILIKNAADEASRAMDNALAAGEAASRSDDEAIRKIHQAIREGRISRERGAEMIRSFTARAEGGPVLRDQPYIIGEKGPELFVPNQSGQIIPNNKIGSGTQGNTVIHVNFSGIFQGNEMQMRELAKRVFQAQADAQMMGTA